MLRSLVVSLIDGWSFWWFINKAPKSSTDLSNYSIPFLHAFVLAFEVRPTIDRTFLEFTSICDNHTLGLLLKNPYFPAKFTNAFTI